MGLEIYVKLIAEQIEKNNQVLKRGLFPNVTPNTYAAESRK